MQLGSRKCQQSLQGKAATTVGGIRKTDGIRKPNSISKLQLLRKLNAVRKLNDFPNPVDTMHAIIRKLRAIRKQDAIGLHRFTFWQGSPAVKLSARELVFVTSPLVTGANAL